MKQKDARMALVSEAIGAIRAVKLHAWEAEFEARIAALRSREVATLLHFQVRNGSSEGPSWCRQILVWQIGSPSAPLTAFDGSRLPSVVHSCDEAPGASDPCTERRPPSSRCRCSMRSRLRSG